MNLGIYVHIPYCVQRCSYCDFTTFEKDQIMQPLSYTNLILNEIRQRASALDGELKNIATIYFGGGTPSILEPELLNQIISELFKNGFQLVEGAEITLEINPATLDKKNLEKYLNAGFNRFSVGAQSFDDGLLKLCGRRHSSQDTRDTLKLLQSFGLNYSFDLLFGLPTQKISQLATDLDEIESHAPDHVSIYYLTVPQGHPLAKNRPAEHHQLKMFDLIEERLEHMGFEQYEISNFAKPGRFSRHNYRYWTDQAYWGLGLSAHSYLPQMGEWGVRFWNPKDFQLYEQQVSQVFQKEPKTLSSKNENSSSVHPSPWSHWLHPDQLEFLKDFEALTDYFYMGLRRQAGVSWAELWDKFALKKSTLAHRIKMQSELGLIDEHSEGFRLSQKGKRLSNQVLEQFTFLKADLIHDSLAKVRYIKNL